MPERNGPDLDHVRDALRQHDERPDGDEPETTPPGDGDGEDEGDDED